MERQGRSEREEAGRVVLEFRFAVFLFRAGIHPYARPRAKLRCLPSAGEPVRTRKCRTRKQHLVACVCACARACVRVCVRACVRACVHACVCAGGRAGGRAREVR